MGESSKFYQLPEYSVVCPSWRELIGPERTRSNSGSFPDQSFVDSDYDKIKKKILDLCHPEDSVFPSREKVFRAFEYFPPEQTKVVILGQDPYPTRGYADGLAFSVDPALERCPESLKAILRKAHYQQNTTTDIKVGRSLEPWAKQNVLLLNQALTVPVDSSEGHMNVGWQSLTGAVLRALLRQKDQPVVIAFGNKARDFVWSQVRNSTGHIRDLICAAHPSPLAHDPLWSTGASDSRNPFRLVNAVLAERGESEIDWLA